MSGLINEEVIKKDLLKTISIKYNIPIDELIEMLSLIRKSKIVKSKYSCDHNFFSRDNEKSFYWAGYG